MDQGQGVSSLELVLGAMLVMFVLALGVIFFFLAYQRRLHKQQKEHQEKETDYQQQLLRANLLSQEKERNRIGKDLHDEVGALLTTSKLYFRHLNHEKSKEEFEDLKGKVFGILEETIASVRRVSHDLRPVVLERLGLVEAIGDLVDQVDQSGDLKIEFVHNVHGDMEKEDELNWYRIVQELVNNTMKHAKASEIIIDISGGREGLVLIYKDNGVGFLGNSEKGTGLGLSNIESRLSLMKGQLVYMEAKVGVQIKMSSYYKKGIEK